MYNEEIEKLIDFALADGVLTDKEKTILFKKAEALGIDKDEFEMVLEGRLQLKQQEETQKREKVLMCPRCNASIPPLTNVCPSCKFVLNASAHQGNDQSLNGLIKKINLCLIEIKSLPDYNLSQLITSVIKKQENKLGRLKAEAEQYSMMARTLYGENKKIMLLVQEIEFKIYQIDKQRRKTFLINLTIFIIVVPLLGLALNYSINWIRDKTISDQGRKSLIEKYMSKGEIEKAKEMAFSIKNEFSREDYTVKVLYAEINHLCKIKKPDEALSLYMDQKQILDKYYIQDVYEIIIDSYISLNKMKDAKDTFLKLYSEGNPWGNIQSSFEKIFFAYLDKNNKETAKFFVQKYCPDGNRGYYLEKLN